MFRSICHRNRFDGLHVRAVNTSPTSSRTAKGCYSVSPNSMTQPSPAVQAWCRPAPSGYADLVCMQTKVCMLRVCCAYAACMLCNCSAVVETWVGVLLLDPSERHHQTSGEYRYQHGCCWAGLDNRGLELQFELQIELQFERCVSREQHLQTINRDRTAAQPRLFVLQPSISVQEQAAVVHDCCLTLTQTYLT